MKNSSYADFQVLTGLTLVEFWEQACVPCQHAEKYLEVLQQAYQGRCNIIKINILEEVQLIEIYDITKLPTFILFKNFVELDRVLGFKNKDLVEKMIRSHL